ncbi:hypothetical protein [Bradyrhizobium sp. 25ACV]
MINAVKIKLRIGVREIEVEGPRNDVDALLERWWQDSDLPFKPAPEGAKATLERHKQKRTRQASRPIDDNADGAFDANATANEIKEHAIFDRITSKIIHAKGDPFNKVALILWISDQPLTSGQIHRTLEALAIRIGLPDVSKTLKKYMSKFLTSAQRRAGGPPATYRLSAQAAADFENWLMKNE